MLLHQTGDCESGSMVKHAGKIFLLPLRCSSLQQEFKFFMSAMHLEPCLKQLNRAHAWSYFAEKKLFCWEETHNLVWSFKANHSAYIGG